MQSHTHNPLESFICLAICHRFDIWDNCIENQWTSNFPSREYGRKCWEREAYSVSSKFEGVRNWDIGKRSVTLSSSRINIRMKWKIYSGRLSPVWLLPVVVVWPSSHWDETHPPGRAWPEGASLAWGETGTADAPPARAPGMTSHEWPYIWVFLK